MKPIRLPKLIRQVSLNYAKLSPEQLDALRRRYTLIQKKREQLQDDLASVKLIESEFEYYKQSLLDILKLRKKKGYNFNLQNGYVHRPNMKPWENGRMKKKLIPDFPDAVKRELVNV
ncbi:hypothetical protein LCGC14_1436620 [marine sediment metagenome]|uniref:Uncharacterized protein n=1 Tax=marine sediment metagenome TaxID=412755 RepID=A0A0F9MNW1_9ZZZZ